MGVSVDITRVAVSTSTGTQDITISGFGTPKAAIFIATPATVDGTLVNDLNYSYGAATGAANEWCFTTQFQDGQGTTVSLFRSRDSRCVRLQRSGSTTVNGEAQFDSFIADGVRIDWITAPDAAWLLTVIMFTGTDLQAHAGVASLGNVLDNAVDITAPGFEPDIVFSACDGSRALPGSGTLSRPSMGIVHNDGAGSVTQRAMAFYFQNGAATARAIGRCTESYGLLEITTGAALDWGGEFGSFDSNGFTVTTRNAGANNTDMAYLALGFGGVVDGHVKTETTPTSTGNDAQTGTGFQPQLVFSLLTQMQAIDTAYVSPLAGAFGFAAFTTSDEYTTSVTNEDNVGISDTASLTDDTAVELRQDDQSTGWTAAFVSMDSNGYTRNYSAVLGTGVKFLSLSIGTEQADVIPIGAIVSDYRMRRVNNVS